jgi:thiamine pyrophosphate-dependent acetolactate synthase large subunit-like protein
MQSLDKRSPRLSRAEYGSDLIVDLLRRLDLPYVALNPGSSFRGIHDSLVNFDGGGPELLLCCHEEIAVAVAHGYARVTGRPMVAAIHDVVGLQHASMAIYNAWCARVPLIAIGGTGPVAVESRRPQTDWNHTALVQGNQVRDYVKWDDQPATLGSIPESLLRAYRIAMTEPSGPVYLCYDVELQEEPISEPALLPEVERFAPPSPVGADPEPLIRAARLLTGAQWPVIVAGTVGRHPDALPALRELAELLAAPVLAAAAFTLPTDHSLNLTSMRPEVLRRADVAIALDLPDLAGAFGQSGGLKGRGDRPQYLKPDARVIQIGVSDLLQHSWASDYQQLVPVDLPITADTRLALPALVDACRRLVESDAGAQTQLEDRRREVETLKGEANESLRSTAERYRGDGAISVGRLSFELHEAVRDLPWTAGALHAGWEVTERNQMPVGLTGSSQGLGLALGIAIGTALAIRDSGRFYVHLTGDGELLFTLSSLWTLANLNLPVLVVVNNNRSYGNDEGHQEYLANVRERPVENKLVGVGIRRPDTDFATVARGFGIEAFGPVEDAAELRNVLRRAAEIVATERRPVLVDVVTQS